MKRKFQRFLVTLALLVVVGTAAGYYCYAPFLPEMTKRFDYHRGWLAAWLGGFDGRYAYSFDRYMVEGLAEYALVKDGIESVVVPEEIRSEAYFLDGFNSCMAKRLGKRLACDFPDDYVKAYLQTGSLDLTVDQPLVCPVHKHVMAVKEIPFEIVYPFTMARPKLNREIASEAHFPYPDSTMKVDLLWFTRPPFAKTRVCPACGKAERQWISENRAPNQQVEPTGTAITDRTDASSAPAASAAHQ